MEFNVDITVSSPPLLLRLFRSNRERLRSGNGGIILAEACERFARKRNAENERGEGRRKVGRAASVGRGGLRDRFFIVTWKRVITHDAIRNERGAGSSARVKRGQQRERTGLSPSHPSSLGWMPLVQVVIAGWRRHRFLIRGPSIYGAARDRIQIPPLRYLRLYFPLLRIRGNLSATVRPGIEANAG